MNYKFSKRSLSRLEGVNPLLIAIMVDGIKDSPHDFGIAVDGGYRTPERQNELYQQGRTILGKKVTNTDGYKKKSYHQTGLAVDIYGYVEGKATWNKQILESIARHLQAVALDRYDITLEWGGDFKNFKDMPHFQIQRSEVD